MFLPNPCQKHLMSCGLGRKSLNYLRVWGCPAEAKLFNPQQKKLHDKTVSCYFIGYPDKSKGYRFYCHDRFTKFVKTRHVVFLEDSGISGSFPRREINLEEIRAELPIPIIQETVTPQLVLFLPLRVHLLFRLRLLFRVLAPLRQL